jgi:hypothetical protein
MAAEGAGPPMAVVVGGAPAAAVGLLQRCRSGGASYGAGSSGAPVAA